MGCTGQSQKGSVMEMTTCACPNHLHFHSSFVCANHLRLEGVMVSGLMVSGLVWCHLCHLCHLYPCQCRLQEGSGLALALFPHHFAFVAVVVAVVAVVVVFWAAGAVARFGGTLFPREKSASTEPVASRLICWNDFASRRDATKEEDEEQSAAEEDEDKKRWEDSSREKARGDERIRRGDVFNAPGGWFLRRCFIPNGHLSVKRRSGKKDDQ